MPRNSSVAPSAHTHSTGSTLGVALDDDGLADFLAGYQDACMDVGVERSLLGYRVTSAEALLSGIAGRRQLTRTPRYGRAARPPGIVDAAQNPQVNVLGQQDSDKLVMRRWRQL